MGSVDDAMARLEAASEGMGAVMHAFPALLDREFDISRARMFALGRLSLSPCGQSELADITMTTPSSASRLVDGLITDGLAERTRDPNDGRAVLVELTDAGVALRASLDARRREIFEEVVGRLGTDAVGQAADAITMLATAMLETLERELRG